MIYKVVVQCMQVRLPQTKERTIGINKAQKYQELTKDQEEFAFLRSRVERPPKTQGIKLPPYKNIASVMQPN